jgi:site-specific recombinase XerD
MFDNCSNLKHLAILSLLYSAALRVSEIVNLKISDIDSKQMVIRIRSAKGRKDRLVPLDKTCLDILRKYYIKYRTKTYLFSGQFSEKYTAHSIQLWIKALAFKSGINKKVYPHLIRHTSLTHNLEMGTDIRKLQVIAGHQNIKTTMGYTHISPKYISATITPLSCVINKKMLVN